jgi:hypothetical protein
VGGIVTGLIWFHPEAGQNTSNFYARWSSAALPNGSAYRFLRFAHFYWVLPS